MMARSFEVSTFVKEFVGELKTAKNFKSMNAIISPGDILATFQSHLKKNAKNIVAVDLIPA